MTNENLVWREFASYVVTTRLEINKLVNEVDEESTIEISRLEEFVNHQAITLLGLKLSVDMYKKEI